MLGTRSNTLLPPRSAVLELVQRSNVLADWIIWEKARGITSMCVHNAAQFDPAELRLLHFGVLDADVVRSETRHQAIHIVENAVNLPSQAGFMLLHRGSLPPCC